MNIRMCICICVCIYIYICMYVYLRTIRTCILLHLYWYHKWPWARTSGFWRICTTAWTWTKKAASIFLLWKQVFRRAVPPSYGDKSFFFRPQIWISFKSIGELGEFPRLNAVDSWASQLRPNPRNMLGRSWFCWGNNPRKSRTGALVQSTDFYGFFYEAMPLVRKLVQKGLARSPLMDSKYVKYSLGTWPASHVWWHLRLFLVCLVILVARLEDLLCSIPAMIIPIDH